MTHDIALNPEDQPIAYSKLRKLQIELSRKILELLSGSSRDRMAAAAALERIGPAAVPALAELLRDPGAGVRRSAAVALGRIGPEAAAAVPALVELLRDPAADVRLSAAAALKQIDEPGGHRGRTSPLDVAPGP
jgi:HEAT repeat protein